MKQIIRLFSLFIFFTSNFAYSQTTQVVVCPPDTIVNICDSGIVSYDTLSTSDFTTIDSISYVFTFDNVDIDSGSGTGSDSMFYKGVTLVTITVWDLTGTLDTSATCDFTISVKDTTPPAISTDTAIAYLDANGGIRIDTSYFTLDIWDNCTVDSIWLSRDSFTCDDIDTASLWIYVTDKSQNIDSVLTAIIIDDLIAPIIDVTDTALVYLDSQGVAAFDTSYFGISTSDACGVDSVWLSQDTIYCPDDTLNKGWVYALDIHGNIDSMAGFVLVRDTIAPSVTCKSDTLYLNNLGEAILFADSVYAGGYDNCGIDTMGLSKSVFGCGNVGLDSTMLYAWDKWGLVDSAQAYVLVLDTIKPRVICNDTTVYLNEFGKVSIDTSFVLASLWDNCSIDTLILSDTLFTCGDTGANSVFIYVSDSSGNMDTCEAIVTVRDIIPPTIICNYDILVQANINTCDTILKISAPEVSDICVFTTITYTLTGATSDMGSGNINDTFGIGKTYIHWLVTDMDGNSAGCIQSVTTYSSLIAVNDTTGTYEDTGLAFYPLHNDIDCDDDINPATLIVTDSTNHGQLEVNENTGAISYHPDANFSGEDTLKYKVWDDWAFVDSAIVYISVTAVNDPPQLTNEVIVVKEDSIVSGIMITSADFDVEGDTLTASDTLFKEPSNGVFIISSDGAFTYTPDENFFGKDTVIVTVCDSGVPNNQCKNDTVFITVTPVNDIPVIANDYLAVDEDNSGTGDITNANDYDPDGTILTASSMVLNPTHGTINIFTDGTFTYIPSPNYYGSDIAVFRVCDGDTPSSCANDTLFITINPVNDAPVLDNEVVVIDEDEEATGDIINTGDIDPEGTDLKASSTLVVSPSNGAFSVDSTGVYNYKPNTNYYGTDTVVVSVCDDGIPGIACANDTLFFTITSVNDAPIIAQPLPDLVLDLYETEIITMNDFFSDPDEGDVLTFSATLFNSVDPLPSWISFDSEAGTFLVIHPDSHNHIGVIQLFATATDKDGESIIDIFNITVKQVYTISGYVITSTGTPPNKSVTLSADETGSPAPDVRMILKSGTENIDTVKTDVNGNYAFKGLVPGTYEVLVDVQFFTQNITAIVELTEAVPEVGDVNFTIWIKNGVITDVSDLNNTFDVNLYPNPSQGSVNLNVENRDYTNVEVSVFNESGREVFKGEYLSGQPIRFDMSGNSSGLYFVKIRSDNKEVIKKLILDKK